MTDEGVGEALDFMPIERPETPTDRHRLVGVVRVVGGTLHFGWSVRRASTKLHPDGIRTHSKELRHV